MGIEDRDYTRDSSDYTGTLTGFGLDYIPPMVKWLIVVNVVAFLLQLFVTRAATKADWERYVAQNPARKFDADAEVEMQADFLDQPISLIEEWFQLDTRLVVGKFQVWRLLTYAFCHRRDDLFGILLNMVALYWCGVVLESLLGSREFLLFYLVAAVFAGIVELAADLYLKNLVPVMGAQGAVLAAAMLYAIHYPRNTIRMFWFWPLEVRWVVLLYALYNLHPLLLALSGNRTFLHSGLAYAANLGGLAFGFLYWKLNLNLERWWDLIPKPRGALAGGGSRARPRRAAARREPNIDEQVDDILRKIHDSGEASLTEAERRLLARASQKYKERRAD